MIDSLLIIDLTNRVKSLQDELAEAHIKMDKLLAHCPDMECHVCASIICPQGCGMHFHHDGCPACAELEG